MQVPAVNLMMPDHHGMFALVIPALVKEPTPRNKHFGEDVILEGKALEQ